MKYILVSVVDRDIYPPVICNTHEEALDKMCEEVADILEVPVEEVKESYLQGKEYNESTCVVENAAWTIHREQFFDWKIFSIGDDWEVS